MSRSNTEKDFWKKVNVKSPDECWEWQGALTSDGYASFHFNKKPIRGHRFSLMTQGIDIKNKLACHTCNNRKCVNPHHLYAGTYTDNYNDRIKSGTDNKCNGKLSETDVIEIRSLYNNGNMYQREIGEMYNIAQTTVSHIIHKRIFKHVA